jgi:hypothetical protein
MNHHTPLYLDWLQRPRAYQPSLFIERDKELAAVRSKVRQAQSSHYLRQPVIHYWGIQGIGKTWLLHHLQHLYSYRHISATFLQLERPTCALLQSQINHPPGQSLAGFVQELAGGLLAQVGPLLQDSEIEQLEQARQSGSPLAFVSALLPFSERAIPLIMFDDVEEIPAATWVEMESSLIEPMAKSGRILIIVSGRQHLPHWQRFEVRRRVMPPDRLPAFDKEAVSRQITQRNYPLSGELLFPYTAGSPHLTDVTAQHILSWARDEFHPQLGPLWFEQHQEGLLQILMAAEHQLLDGFPEQLRPVLNVLSPLRFYRLEALKQMLAQQKDFSAGQPDGYYLTLLRNLDRQTDVVWWQHDKRAYVTNEIIRQLINRREWLSERRRYIHKHQLASNMYWQWVRQRPHTSEDFVLEIWFHQASIFLADKNETLLQTKIGETMRLVQNYFGPDHILILQKQFEADHDLHDLLPAALHTYLGQELDSLLPHDSFQEGSKGHDAPL